MSKNPSEQSPSQATAKASLVAATAQRSQRGVMHLFEKVDFVFAGQPVKCALADGQDAPAWTVGRTASEPAHIYFDPVRMGPLESHDDWLAWLAANYHEAGHVAFTPNLGMASGPSAREFMRVWSRHPDAAILLEDQRMESFMVAAFPSMANYYRVSFSKYCLADEESIDQAWLWAYGRKFLDPGLIRELRGLFNSPRKELAAEAAQIIDEYRQLDLSRSNNLYLGARLIERFAALWEELNQHDPRRKQDHHKSPQGGCSVIREDGQPKETTESEASKNTAEKVKQGAGSNDDESTSDEAAGSPSEEESPGPGSEDGKGNQEGSSEQGSSENDEEQEVEQDDSSTTSHGAGGAKQSGSTKRAIEQLEALLADSSSASEVASEVERLRKIVRTTPINRQHASFTNWTTWGGSMDGLVKQISRQLEQVREDADPGWRRHQPAGRLNIQRAMQGGEIDELFDEWQEGNTDATSIEWVVLLDGSGSMGRQQEMLSRTAWALKRAADHVDIRCTVMRYSDQGSSEMVYHATERALPTKHPYISASGSTFPFEVLEEAYAILASTKMKKRLLTIMTDGEWQDPDGTWPKSPECDELVAAINSLPGCVTNMVYSDPQGRTGMDTVNWHGCHTRTMIKGVEGLVPSARQFISDLMRKR